MTDTEQQLRAQIAQLEMELADTRKELAMVQELYARTKAAREDLASLYIGKIEREENIFQRQIQATISQAI